MAGLGQKKFSEDIEESDFEYASSVGQNVYKTNSLERSNKGRRSPNQMNANEKKATKLLKDLDILNGFSNALGQNIKKQKQEQEDKKSSILQKSKGEEMKVEGQISQVQRAMNGVINDIETRKVKLQQVQEVSFQKKKELFTLKQLQEQLVREFQTEKDLELQKQNYKIQQITEKIELQKLKINDEKRKKKELEDKIEFEEEQRLGLSMRLNEMGNQIDKIAAPAQTKSEFEKHVIEQERLYDKIHKIQELVADKEESMKTTLSKNRELFEERQRLQQQVNEGESIDFNGTQKRLEQVQKVNHESNQRNMEIVEKIKELRDKINKEQQQRIELVTKANLLKDVNKFERYSRKLQSRIEKVEDSERLQEDTLTEIQSCFHFIQSESKTSNVELKSQMDDFEKLLKKEREQKIEIQDQIGFVVKKLDSKMDIEGLEQIFNKLQNFDPSLQVLEANNNKQSQKMAIVSRDFCTYENQMKLQYQQESDSLLYENDRLIDDVTQNLKQVSEQLKKIDSQLRDKNVHLDEYFGLMESVRIQLLQSKELFKELKEEVEDEKEKLLEFNEKQELNKEYLNIKHTERLDLLNNLTTLTVFNEFVSQNKDWVDQNERLKTLSSSSLSSLVDKLHELDTAVMNLEQGLVGSKVEQCQELIRQGQLLCDNIENDLQQLESKLKLLIANSEKLNIDDKKEVDKEIEQTLQNIEVVRKNKDKVKRGIGVLQKNSVEDLIENEQELKNAVEQLVKVQEREVKKVENDVEVIEEHILQGIRKKRNLKKKECLEEIQNAKNEQLKLEGLIDQVERMVENLEDEICQLQSNNQCEDMERNKDIREKLKERVIEEQRRLSELQEEKEQMQDAIEGIEKDVQMITQSIVSSQPLTVKNKQNGNVLKDEVCEQWQDCINNAKQIKTSIKSEIHRGIEVSEAVQTVKAVADELNAKYDEKNVVHKDCSTQKKKNENKIVSNRVDIDEIGRNLVIAEKLLSKVIVPDTEEGKVFKKKVDSIHEQITNVKDKSRKLEDKHKSLMDKQMEMVKDLDSLSDKIVLTRELQYVKEELGMLELELQDHYEDIKNNQWKCDEIVEEAQKMIDENIRVQDNLLVEKLRELRTKVEGVDGQVREVQGKKDEYQKLIKDGLLVNDQSVQQQMKVLQKECVGIDERIKQTEKERNQVKVQEKVLRERLMQVRKDPKVASIQELDQLVQKTDQQIDACQSLKSTLNLDYSELEKRIEELQKFLTKYSDLQNMNSEFDQMMSEVGQNYQNFLKRLKSADNIQVKVKPVLDAMHSGIDGDYKLKEALIARQYDELDEVVLCFKRLNDMKDLIEPQILSIQADSEGTVNSDQLQQLLESAMELLDKLDKAEKNAEQCEIRVARMKDTLYNASDVPILIQQRESEITEFSGKLRKIEGDFQELKRQLSNKRSGENQIELSRELKELDQCLQVFREQRVVFKRILGQELQLFLPNPKVLQDLDILTATIIKIIELGVSTNKALDEIDKIQTKTLKLKRAFGELDLMKRFKDLRLMEEDQRKRLIEVKKRLDRIGKGASDCDGYTSNTEEGSFIETLINEIPEMKMKQSEAVDECTQIADSLNGLEREVQSGQDVERVTENLDFLEEQGGVNEKTVAFLEKIADKLEEHFLQMDVKSKLQKREMELQELSNICEDFDFQLSEMQSNLNSDISQLEVKKKGYQEKMSQNQVQQVIITDEYGKQVDIFKELFAVQDELQGVLHGVIELQVRNQEVQQKREEAWEEFGEKIIRNSPYKQTPGKIVSKTDVFYLLKSNGQIKHRIMEMITHLKEISKKLRHSKKQYDKARLKLERQNKQKQYKAHKGDIVDELFADYMNRLNCPVPIHRLGNNQYMFGTRKIFAKIINGKLVIRVGGGYMGIEEFMMYYGQQELQRIQKMESVAQEDVLVEDVDSEEEGSGRKSRGEGDMERLKKRLRKNNSRKSLNSRQLEQQQDDDKSTKVLGLGDVRKALRQNFVEIKTYQDHNTVGQSTIEQQTASRNQGLHSQRVGSQADMVEKQLKNLEKNAVSNSQQKVAAIRNMRSPKRSPMRSNMQNSGSNQKLRKNEDLDSSTTSYQSVSKEEFLEEFKEGRRFLQNKSVIDSEKDDSIYGKYQSKIPMMKKANK